MNGLENLLSVAQVAKRLKLHRTRIHQMIRSGDLPAKMIAGRYLIHEDDLLLVKKRRPPGRPPTSIGQGMAKSSKAKKKEQ